MPRECGTVFRQNGFDVRLEWGPLALDALSDCRSQVIVDVLSFSTCIDIAAANGAEIFPFSWKDERAVQFARDHDAVLAASDRRAPGPTLSPASLTGLRPGTRLVLPSPNGSAISAAADAALVVAGCLRNASAVARALATWGGPIGIIAAGERWPDGSLRPCLEDLLGAGAIIAALPGSKSPEASAAQAIFTAASPRIADAVADCASGRELRERGFAADADLAAAVDASRCVPILRGGRYARMPG